jgi:hypothetical protein
MIRQDYPQNFRLPDAPPNPALWNFVLSSAKAKVSSMRLQPPIFSPEEIRAAELEEHEAEVEVARCQKRR